MTKRRKPEGEVFEGRSGEMAASPWLASEDLLGLGRVKVVIERCHRYRNVEFDRGRMEEVVYTLQFAGKSKQMVLNSTNRRALVSLFGPNVKDWAGKEIFLYVDTNVRFAGKTVNGIRIATDV